MAAEPHPYAVATADAGSQALNTLAPTGRDVLVPLQDDLDGDPLQDDEVRIASHCGRHQQVVLASSADATADADTAMVYYRFRHVPPGWYSLAVRIGGTWVLVSNELAVTPRAAYLNGKRLPAQPPQHRYQPRRLPDATAPARPARPRRGLPRYIDLNPAFQDRN